MCLDNARSYLDDADMYISNNKTDHLAIPIAFAMEEIGKAKIIFNKTKDSSEITLSYTDGIYSHETKMKQAISMINLDMDEKSAESLMLGDDLFDYLLDPIVISKIISKERELLFVNQMPYEKIVLSGKGYVSSEALSRLSENNRNGILADTQGNTQCVMSGMKSSLTTTKYRIIQLY